MVVKKDVNEVLNVSRSHLSNFMSIHFLDSAKVQQKMEENQHLLLKTSNTNYESFNIDLEDRDDNEENIPSFSNEFFKLIQILNPVVS
jgi:hypothetical protein